MAREKKIYSDDDGRVIADMSGIERQPLVLPRLKKRREETSEEDPQSEVSLSKQERASYAFGALSASLLIGAVFVAAFAVAIALLLIFWH